MCVLFQWQKIKLLPQRKISWSTTHIKDIISFTKTQKIQKKGLKIFDPLMIFELPLLRQVDEQMHKLTGHND